jgi:hypothetical protein
MVLISAFYFFFGAILGVIYGIWWACHRAKGDIDAFVEKHTALIKEYEKKSQEAMRMSDIRCKILLGEIAKMYGENSPEHDSYKRMLNEPRE